MLFLVALERFGAGYKHTFTPLGPQPRVNLVQLTGAGLRGQEMYELADETRKEHGVIELLVATGHLPATPRVVQENQVQVGAVRKLQSAELAVTDDAESGISLLTVDDVGRSAVLRCKVAPCNMQRIIQHRLGQPGESVADFHDWQRAIEISDSYVKHGRALKPHENCRSLLGVSIRVTCQPLVQLRLQIVLGNEAALAA